VRKSEWEKLPEEEKERRRAVKRAWYARTEAAKTPEQKQAVRPARSAHVRRWRSGRSEEKKAEERARSAAWRATNPVAAKISWKNWWLNTNYGISLEDYTEMVADQEGRCLICSEPTDKLVVDHDHKTNEVRGLLCSACNTGLGHFKDSTDRLRSAIDYLTKSRQPDNMETANGFETVQPLFH
jgi:hypothetical protein